MINDRNLIEKAAALSRAAPSQWSDFLAAFKEYSDQQAMNCVQAPLEVLQGAQGKARESALLLKLYQECRQRADGINASRAAKASNNRSSSLLAM